MESSAVPIAARSNALDGLQEGQPPADSGADHQSHSISAGTETPIIRSKTDYFSKQAEEAAASGNREAGLPVRWQHLTVHGSGTGDVLVQTLPWALLECTSLPLAWRAIKAISRRVGGYESLPERTLLSDLYGCVEQVYPSIDLRYLDFV